MARLQLLIICLTLLTWGKCIAAVPLRIGGNYTAAVVKEGIMDEGVHLGSFTCNLRITNMGEITAPTNLCR